MEISIEQVILKTLKESPCNAQCMDVKEDREVVAREVTKAIKNWIA